MTAMRNGQIHNVRRYRGGREIDEYRPPCQDHRINRLDLKVLTDERTRGHTDRRAHIRKLLKLSMVTNPCQIRCGTTADVRRKSACNVSNTIRPALDAGTWVVSDRFTDSTSRLPGRRPRTVADDDIDQSRGIGPRRRAILTLRSCWMLPSIQRCSRAGRTWRSRPIRGRAQPSFFAAGA